MAVANAIGRVVNSEMAGHAHTLPCLARIARAKAERWKAATAVDAQFKSWLAGKPAAPTGQIAPTRRAFQWVKGTVRWVKSPLGKQFQNDEIPDELEIDDAEGCDFTQSSNDCAAPIWQDGSATCDTPLCDQADVEAEVDSWANVW